MSSNTPGLAYLDDERRGEAITAMDCTGARRLSFEGRGIDPSVAPLDAPITPTTLFDAALDAGPYAVADGHGNHLRPAPQARTLR